MTPQAELKAKLALSGIPHKAIQCYGSQIVITTRGRASAEQWASLLGKFARVRAMFETTDENQVNSGSTLKPSRHAVWRVAATL